MEGEKERKFEGVRGEKGGHGEKEEGLEGRVKILERSGLGCE